MIPKNVFCFFPKSAFNSILCRISDRNLKYKFGDLFVGIIFFLIRNGF